MLASIVLLLQLMYHFFSYCLKNFLFNLMTSAAWLAMPRYSFTLFILFFSNNSLNYKFLWLKICGLDSLPKRGSLHLLAPPRVWACCLLYTVTRYTLWKSSYWFAIGFLLIVNCGLMETWWLLNLVFPFSAS